VPIRELTEESSPPCERKAQNRRDLEAAAVIEQQPAAGIMLSIERDDPVNFSGVPKEIPYLLVLWKLAVNLPYNHEQQEVPHGAKTDCSGEQGQST